MNFHLKGRAECLADVFKFQVKMMNAVDKDYTTSRELNRSVARKIVEKVLKKALNHLFFLNHSKNKKNQMNSHQLLIKAANFAALAHKDQRRKANKAPYFNHVIGVANILASEAHVTDPEVLAAALLHDTVEDCPPISIQDLRKEFGPRVAFLVSLVTDDKSLGTADRKRLQVEHVQQKDFDHGARLVKAADKIYNLRDTMELPPPNWTLERIQGFFAWNCLIYMKGLLCLNEKLDEAFHQCFSGTFILNGITHQTLPLYHLFESKPNSEFIKALEAQVEDYYKLFY